MVALQLSSLYQYMSFPSVTRLSVWVGLFKLINSPVHACVGSDEVLSAASESRGAELPDADCKLNRCKCGSRKWYLITKRPKTHM